MTDARELERALQLAARKYDDLDVGHIRHGLPELPARDWTWEEWLLQIESLARLLRVDAERPTPDRVAVVAANALALLIAIERAETLDVAAGAETRRAA